MQNIKKPKVKKQFSVIIDRSLDQYDTQILFPEKLEKANQTFRRIGFPKQFMKH
jgi:hypothetical protein